MLSSVIGCPQRFNSWPDGLTGHAALYLISQFVGGSCAVLMLYGGTPMEKTRITTTYPIADGVKEVMVWTMEISISYIALLIILMTTFGQLGQRRLGQTEQLDAEAREEAPQTHHEINSIISGAVFFVCASVGGPVSGGYMNPLIPMGIGILSPSNKVGPFIVNNLKVAILFKPQKQIMHN